MSSGKRLTRILLRRIQQRKNAWGYEGQGDNSMGKVVNVKLKTNKWKPERNARGPRGNRAALQITETGKLKKPKANQTPPAANPPRKYRDPSDNMKKKRRRPSASSRGQISPIRGIQGDRGDREILPPQKMLRLILRSSSIQYSLKGQR